MGHLDSYSQYRMSHDSLVALGHMFSFVSSWRLLFSLARVFQSDSLIYLRQLYHHNKFPSFLSILKTPQVQAQDDFFLFSLLRVSVGHLGTNYSSFALFPALFG